MDKIFDNKTLLITWGGGSSPVIVHRAGLLYASGSNIGCWLCDLVQRLW